METITYGDGVLATTKLVLLQMAQKAAGAAIEELLLTTEKATFLLQQNGELAAQIKEAVQHAVTEFLISDDFSDEEVHSTHGYNTGYNHPRSIERQLELLKEYFPDIQFEPLPEMGVRKPLDVEGLFLIPRWRLFGRTYGAAVERVFQRLKKERNGFFKNMCHKELDSKRLRQSKLTRDRMRALAEQQNHPKTLLLPAQFGVRHEGRSARRARVRFAENEFGVGVFATAIMLLLHSDRMGSQYDLSIMCVGDEYNRARGRRFEGVPMFRFDHETGVLEFTDGSASLALSESSSVTAFLPNG